MYKSIKTGLDIFMSLCLIAILIMPMIVIALLVKSTSKGPVLFKQQRYGINSRKFKIYKFRTMYVETPELSNQEFESIDNFVTPVGKILRKFSLDELPQLFNIIKGNMSFIGPRPLAESDIDVVKMRKRSGADRIKPGITGLAQVNGRNNILDSQKAYFDKIYADNISFSVDLKIIIGTLLNVTLAKNINRS